MRLYVSFSVTPLEGLSLEATIWPAFSVLSNCWPAPIELRGCRTTSVGSRRRTAQGHSRRGSGCAWPNDRESGYDRLDIDGSIGSRAPSLPHRRQDPAGWITPGQTSARPGRVPKPGLDREKAVFFLCGTLRIWFFQNGPDREREKAFATGDRINYRSGVRADGRAARASCLNGSQLRTRAHGSSQL